MPTATTCTALLIQNTPDVDPIIVNVRVSEPAGRFDRGTIVLGTGGFGTTFYEEQAGGFEVAKALTNAGFRVVQRKWVGNASSTFGWPQRGDGHLKMSLRYATLLQWVYDNVHVGQGGGTGSFGAVGSSGGGGEIGYALSKWGMACMLDVAVLISGPPQTRLDLICEDAGAAWSNCQSQVPNNVAQCTLNCSFPNNMAPFGGCTTLDLPPQNITASDLANESILHPTAVTDYSTTSPAHETRLHLITGAADCETGMPAIAQTFYDAIQSQKVIQFVNGASHLVNAPPAGQDAIVNAVLAGTTSQILPATLSPTSWPTDGSSFTIDVQGPPSGLAHLQYSLSTIPPSFCPGLGWALLDEPNTLIKRTLNLDPHGKTSFTVPATFTVGASGNEIFLQAWMQDSSFNLALLHL